MGKKKKPAKRAYLAPIRLDFSSVKPHSKKIRGLKQQLRQTRREAPKPIVTIETISVRERQPVKTGFQTSDDDKRKADVIVNKRIQEGIKSQIKEARVERVKEAAVRTKKFAKETGERVLTLARRYGGERVVSRKVLRKQDTRAVVKEFHAPSVLDDPNRFFKDEYEEDKRSFFFK